MRTSILRLPAAVHGFDAARLCRATVRSGPAGARSTRAARADADEPGPALLADLEEAGCFG